MADRYELVADQPGPRYEMAPEPIKIGAEGLPDAVRAVFPDYHPWYQMGTGALGGMQNTYLRLKQLFNRDMQTPGASYQFTPEEESAIRTNRAVQEGNTPALAGAITAGAGATLPFAGPVFTGAKAAANAVLPGILAKLLGSTAGAGAVGAAVPTLTEPVLPGESAETNAAHGALGAGAADLALRGAGRVVQPIMQSAPVQTLLQNKIVPTIGQAAGNFANAAEEKLSSLPIVGDVIKSARRRAVQELNQAAIQRAAPEVKAVGREGLEEAERSVGRGYDEALAQVNVKADPSFVPHLESFADNRSRMMSDEQRKTVRQFINSVVDDNTDNGRIAGEMAKKIDSELGGKAAQWRASSSASEREMGYALQDAQGAYRQAMARGAATPEVAAALDDLNGKWTQIVRLQRAVASGKEGIFTPGQLQQSVRQSDTSLRKNKFAIGRAAMQDLSDPALSVLRDRYPDSGTAGRVLMASLLTGGAGGVNEAFGGPRELTKLAAMLAVSPLLYSRAASRYALGDLIPGQGALAGALRGLSPYASGAAGLYAQKPGALAPYNER